MPQPFRIDPALPVGDMKTYSIDAPAATHWRIVDCGTFNCATSAAGWTTRVDEATTLGQRQAHYIRRVAARPFVEQAENGTTAFIFPAGTECFQEHRVRVERPDIFTVRGGDWRGIRGDTRTHTTAENWVEDFAEHQNRIKHQLER